MTRASAKEIALISVADMEQEYPWLGQLFFLTEEQALSLVPSNIIDLGDMGIHIIIEVEGRLGKFCTRDPHGKFAWHQFFVSRRAQQLNQ